MASQAVLEPYVVDVHKKSSKNAQKYIGEWTTARGPFEIFKGGSVVHLPTYFCTFSIKFISY